MTRAIRVISSHIQAYVTSVLQAWSGDGIKCLCKGIFAFAIALSVPVSGYPAGPSSDAAVETARDVNVTELWHGTRFDGVGYKVTGLSCIDDGVVVMTSDVYRPRHGNRTIMIAVDGDGSARRVYEGREELALAAVGGFIPVEHGNSLLRLSPSGQIDSAVKLPSASGVENGCIGNGRPCIWNMAAALAWDETPIIAYNLGPYRYHGFVDAPSLARVEDGELSSQIKISSLRAMVSSLTFDGEHLWGVTTFGRDAEHNAVFRLDSWSSSELHILGETRGADVTKIAWHNETLYGGGGRATEEAFPDEQHRTSPAALYRLSDESWQEIETLPSSRVTQLASECGSLWVSSANRDQLMRLDDEGDLHVVAAAPEESEHPDPRGFGSSFAICQGAAESGARMVYWARSDFGGVTLYRLEGAGAQCKGELQ